MQQSPLTHVTFQQPIPFIDWFIVSVDPFGEFLFLFLKKLLYIFYIIVILFFMSKPIKSINQNEIREKWKTINRHRKNVRIFQRLENHKMSQSETKNQKQKTINRISRKKNTKILITTPKKPNQPPI